MKSASLSVSFFQILITYVLTSGVGCLRCYRCDGLNQVRQSNNQINHFDKFFVKAQSDCPGWRRRPVDTIRDLGDLGGLYTHCVDVRLDNGTVLYQNTQSLHPICVDGFLQMWKQDLIQVKIIIINMLNFNNQSFNLTAWKQT